MEQEQNSLIHIDDSFKKIIVIKDRIKLWRNEKGIVVMGITDFLLNPNKCFDNDHPNESLIVPKWDIPDDTGNLETMLYSRMLLSCLADADYSVSAWEDDKTYFETTQSPKLDTDECLNKLYQFRDRLREHSVANADVDDIRNQMFEICGDCGAHQSRGLFTLTAPTGTGKTLALLHFALRHAKATNKRRIIIVLPFLTLIEQNAKVYEEIMPAVLEDHSQSRLCEEMREFASKWNMPFIITTSVKFFESLFANKPTDCRKLHNLAQSVVVFDEAQSLPPHLIGATLKAVNELCRRYQMTMVFSTATQPNFETISDVNWKPIEILPNHAKYYNKLRRVNVNWHLKEQIPLSDLAEQMSEKDNVCAIFNLRRHAREVFERLLEEDRDSAFLISTDLCPAHRIQVVNTIRQRLKDKKPCRVAATQCIEAGVDLDFMYLYRALAPLDAIIQAAGRCNRNGNQEMGQVTVFIPNDKRLYPDDWYGNAAEIVSRIVQCNGIDINDPNHIKRYYTELFAYARDQQKLTKAINDRDYTEVDKEYRLIKSDGEKLIVPYSEMMTLYRAIGDEIRKNGITPSLMKEAAPITITLYDSGSLEQFAEPVFMRNKLGKEAIKSGYWILREQYGYSYTEKGGFTLPDTNEMREMIF